MNENKEVFILGAGFSKLVDERFPVTTDLCKEILGNLPKIHQTRLYQINPDIADDLERLMSFLISDLPWKDPSDVHFDRGIFTAISTEISKYFLNLHRQQGSLNPILKNLINYIHENRSPMLSFNYDLLIETLFEAEKTKELEFSGCDREFRFRTNYKFNWEAAKTGEGYKFDINYQDSNLSGKIITPQNYQKKEFIENLKSSLRLHKISNDGLAQNIFRDFSQQESAYRQVHWKHLYQMPIAHLHTRFGDGSLGPPPYKWVHLLKLHGSINWYYSGTNSFPSEQIYYAEPVKELLAQQPNVDLVPFIIPPVLDKTTFYQSSAIRKLWSDAGRYLRDADNVYIIGYTFPETDLASRFLLQQNIKPTAKIWIIGKTRRRDELRQRLRQNFPFNEIEDQYLTHDFLLDRFITDLTDARVATG